MNEELDPGIADTVRLLQAHGFITTDSGDGVSKPADARVFDVPHVAAAVPIHAMVSEAERMRAVLGDGWVVQASYSTEDKRAIALATKA